MAGLLCLYFQPALLTQSNIVLHTALPVLSLRGLSPLHPEHVSMLVKAVLTHRDAHTLISFRRIFFLIVNVNLDKRSLTS